MAKNAESTNVQVVLSKGEIRSRLANLKSLFESDNDWKVVFGLKVRNLMKKFEAIVSDANDEAEAKGKSYQKKLSDLQKELAKQDEYGQFILEDGNKFTFETPEKKSEYIRDLNALNEEHNKFYEELDEALKEEVTVEALPIPESCLPESAKGKLLQAISEFIE